jgi:hypothetical protein
MATKTKTKQKPINVSGQVWTDYMVHYGRPFVTLYDGSSRTYSFLVATPKGGAHQRWGFVDHGDARKDAQRYIEKEYGKGKGKPYQEAAKAKKAPAKRVSTKMRAGEKEDGDSTFLVFEDRDQFDLALSFQPYYNELAQVDSASMQIRLNGAKDDFRTKKHIAWLRSKKGGKQAAKFRVYNPHPPRPFKADPKRPASEIGRIVVRQLHRGSWQWEVYLGRRKTPVAFGKARRQLQAENDARAAVTRMDTGRTFHWEYPIPRDDPAPKRPATAKVKALAKKYKWKKAKNTDGAPFYGRAVWVMAANPKVVIVKAESGRHLIRMGSVGQASRDTLEGAKALVAELYPQHRAALRGKAKTVAKKKTKKRTARPTFEVVKFAVGDYEWRDVSSSGRKPEGGKSKKKATAIKTIKGKARKRGFEDAKVKHRDATEAERSRHGVRKKGRKAKVAKDRCARRGPISSSTRKELPSKAFALPDLRSYPLYKLGGDGKLVPSASHASNAKARAKQALNRRKITRATYNKIVRKANKVLAQCSPAVRKARSKAKASTRRKVKRELSSREQRSILNAAVKELAGV